MADAETGEFWGFFGGFAPLPRKTAVDEDRSSDSETTKLYRYSSFQFVLSFLLLCEDDLQQTYFVIYKL